MAEGLQSTVEANDPMVMEFERLMAALEISRLELAELLLTAPREGAQPRITALRAAWQAETRHMTEILRFIERDEAAQRRRLSIGNHVATAEEVAEALGLTPKQLMRQCRRLTETTGFPPRLPGSNWRWSRRAVESWIRASGRPAEIIVSNDPEATRRDLDQDALIAEQRAALHRRYASR